MNYSGSLIQALYFLQGLAVDFILGHSAVSGSDHAPVCCEDKIMEYLKSWNILGCNEQEHVQPDQVSQSPTHSFPGVGMLQSPVINPAFRCWLVIKCWAGKLFRSRFGRRGDVPALQAEAFNPMPHGEGTDEALN